MAADDSDSAGRAGNPASPAEAAGSLDDIYREIDEVASVVSRAVVTPEAFESRTKTLDRSRIAKLIVRVFAATALLTVVFVFVGVLLDYAAADATAPSHWKEGARVIVDLLSSIMLPVVTLVIGFYFGSEKKE